MSAEMEVRKASGQFYAALNRMLCGDADPLADIWSHGAAATTMHPIGGRQVGWHDVHDAWKRVARLTSDGQVELRDQLLHVVGDMAYEAGVEQGKLKLAGGWVAIDHRVSNVYRRESGAWKIVHHHADTSPSMQDALRESQVASGQDKRDGNAC